MTPLESITKSVLDQIKGPVPVRVDKSYIKKESGGYCFDGTILLPETLEETGEIMKEISISPIWAGKGGQGIFCPPEKDQVVIVSFLHFNKAFPYYSGIWADSYIPAAGAEGQFVLTDGKGGVFKMTGSGLFSMANTTISLKSLLDGFCDQLTGLKMADPVSGAIPVFPDNIALIEALKTQIATLLEG